MKYIVTNMQYNAGVNKEFLKNILRFAKEHEVETLLTFVQNGCYKTDDQLAEEVFSAGFDFVESKSINNTLRLEGYENTCSTD